MQQLTINLLVVILTILLRALGSTVPSGENATTKIEYVSLTVSPLRISLVLLVLPTLTLLPPLST